MTGSLRIYNGKYYGVLNLRDDFGKRKQKTVDLYVTVAQGKRKAETALRKVLVDYEKNHVVVCHKDILFCDYMKIWLDEVKSSIEVVTYEAYESYIDIHIYPFFQKQGISLQDLTYQHIQKYYNLKMKTLSANSLRKHHVVINQTLKKALKHDLISNNPADKVTLPKVQRYVGNFLSVEQGNTLLDVSKGTPIETAVILGMMYGLRRSEIAGMKWSAIDFENDTLTVKHTRVQYKSQIAKDKTKNQSSNRILPLNKEVKSYLLKLQEQQEQDKLLLGAAYQNTDYICRWADGREMRCDYLTHAFKKLLSKNNLPDIRLHDLRHSCASYMLKMNCSMKEIADWLGHSDIKTSMNVYGHLDMETKKDVADRFGSFLSL